MCIITHFCGQVCDRRVRVKLQRFNFTRTVLHNAHTHRRGTTTHSCRHKQFYPRDRNRTTLDVTATFIGCFSSKYIYLRLHRTIILYNNYIVLSFVSSPMTLCIQWALCNKRRLVYSIGVNTKLPACHSPLRIV